MNIHLNTSFFNNKNEAMKDYLNEDTFSIKINKDNPFKNLLHNEWTPFIQSKNKLSDDTAFMLPKVEKESLNSYKHKDILKDFNSFTRDTIISNNSYDYESKDTQISSVTNLNEISNFNNNINDNSDNFYADYSKSISDNNQDCSEYEASFDKDKVASDIKALESDIKRIETNIQNKEIKQELSKIRQELKQLRKKIEEGDFSSEDILNVLSHIEKLAGDIAELSLTKKDFDFTRIIKLLDSINKQLNKDFVNKEISKAESLIKDIDKLISNIKNKTNSDNNKINTSKSLQKGDDDISNLVKDINDLLGKLNKILKDSSESKTEGANKIPEKVVKELKAQVKTIEELINNNKLNSKELTNIKELLSDTNKALENTSNLKKIEIEIRDIRTIKAINHRNVESKDSKNNKSSNSSKTLKDTNKNLGENKSSNIENSGEVKTELFIKNSGDIQQTGDGKNFASALSKASQNSANVNSKDIMTQLVRKAAINLKNDKSEIVIQLKPESLGKVKMKLSVSEGEITGKIIVESNEVKKIIQNNMNELIKSLEESGLSLDTLDISLGSGYEDFQLQHSDIEFGSMKGDGEEDAIDDGEKLEEDLTEKDSANMPDWMAGNVNMRG
ncbi:MAG: flagellar hook-length control protein FliK [Spirochaetota bacterium]